MSLKGKEYGPVRSGDVSHKMAARRLHLRHSPQTKVVQISKWPLNCLNTQQITLKEKMRYLYTAFTPRARIISLGLSLDQIHFSHCIRQLEARTFYWDSRTNGSITDGDVNQEKLFHCWQNAYLLLTWVAVPATVGLWVKLAFLCFLMFF